MDVPVCIFAKTKQEGGMLILDWRVSLAWDELGLLCIYITKA